MGNNNNNDKEKKKKPGILTRFRKSVGKRVEESREQSRERSVIRKEAERKERLILAKQEGIAKARGKSGFRQRLSIPKKKTPTTRRISKGRTPPTKARIIKSNGQTFIVVDTPKTRKKRRAAPKQKKTRVQLRRTPLKSIVGGREEKNPFDFI